MDVYEDANERKHQFQRNRMDSDWQLLETDRYGFEELCYLPKHVQDQSQSLHFILEIRIYGIGNLNHKA